MLSNCSPGIGKIVQMWVATVVINSNCQRKSASALRWDEGWRGMEGSNSSVACSAYYIKCVCAVQRQRLAKNGEDRLIDDLATEGLPIDRWASHYTWDFPISLTTSGFIRKVNSGFLKSSWWISGGTPKKVVICYQSAPNIFLQPSGE